MAHYLSNVTLGKLDHRREDVPDGSSEIVVHHGHRQRQGGGALPSSRVSIRPDHDVAGFVRCAEAAVCQLSSLLGGATTNPAAADANSASRFVAQYGGSTPPDRHDAAAFDGLDGGGSDAHDATAMARLTDPDDARLELQSLEVPQRLPNRAVGGSATVHAQNIVWTGEQDGEICIRRWADGAPLATIERKSRVFVFALASPSQSQMWAALSDGYVRVFDTASFRLVDEFRAHCAAINDMCVLRCQAGTSAADGADTTPNKDRDELRRGVGSPPLPVDGLSRGQYTVVDDAEAAGTGNRRAASPAGAIDDGGAIDDDDMDSDHGGSDPTAIRVVATASVDWTVALWDASSHGLLIRLSGHTNNVRCMAHFKGCFLYSAGDDSTIRAWDLSKKREIVPSVALLSPLAAAGTGPHGIHAANSSAVSTTASTTMHRGGSTPRRAARGAVTDDAGPSAEALVVHGRTGNIDLSATVKALASRHAVSSPQRPRGRSPDARGGRTGSSARSATPVPPANRAAAAAGFPVAAAHGGAAVTQLVLCGGPKRRFIVSSGYDGLARVWSRKNGAPMLTLETRPCAITSLMVERLHRQLWVGGIDGVITVYDADTLEHVATRHDHNGAYVSGFKAMKGSNAMKVWSLDESGTLVQMLAGSDIVTGKHVDDTYEAELVDTIDGLRERMMQNYDDITNLRTEHAQLAAREQTRKSHLGSFACHSRRTKLRSLLKTFVFLRKRNASEYALRICSFLARTASDQVRRRTLMKWMTYFFTAKNQRAKMILTRGVTQLRSGNVKKRYLVSLFEAARRKKAMMAMLDFAQIFVVNGAAKSLLQSWYFRWLRWAKHLRQRRSKFIMAHIVQRTSKNAILDEYWHRIVKVATAKRVAAAKNKALQLVFRSTGLILLSVYWAKWVEARPLLRSRVSLNNTVVLFSERANKSIADDYFDRWRRYVYSRRAVHELEELERVRQEQATWNDALCGDGGFTEVEVNEARATLRQQQDDVDRESTEYDILVMNLQAEADRLRQQLAVRAAGMVFHADAPPSDHLVQIVALMKSRGVSCSSDFDALSRSRDTINNAITAKIANMQRAATAQYQLQVQQAQAAAAAAATSQSATRTPSNSPRAPRQSMRAQPSPAIAAAAASVPMPKPPRVPFDEPFAFGMLRLKTAVFDYMRNDSFRAVPPAAAVVLREPTGDTAADVAAFASPTSGARRQWGLPLDRIVAGRYKDLKPVFAALKELTMGYDMAVAALIPPVREPVAVARFRAHLVEEFNLNGHIIIALAGVEYQRSLDAGITAGDEYRKETTQTSGASAPTNVTPRARGTSMVSRSVAPGLGAQLVRAVATKAPAPASPRTPPGGPPPTSNSPDGTPRGTDAAAKPPSPRAGAPPSPHATGAAVPRAPGGASPRTPPAAATPSKAPAPGRKASPPAVGKTSPSVVAAKDGRTPPPAAASPQPSPSAAAPRPFVGFKIGSHPVSHAVIFTETAPGSPAALAGLLPGDEVVRVNSFRVTDAAAFNAVMQRSGAGTPGSKLVFEVSRKESSGATRLLTLTLVVGSR